MDTVPVLQMVTVPVPVLPVLIHIQAQTQIAPTCNICSHQMLSPILTTCNICGWNTDVSNGDGPLLMLLLLKA